MKNRLSPDTYTAAVSLFQQVFILLTTVCMVFSIGIFFDGPGYLKGYYFLSLLFVAPGLFLLFRYLFKKISFTMTGARWANYILLPALLGACWYLFYFTMRCQEGYTLIYFSTFGGKPTNGEYVNSQLGIYGIISVLLSFFTCALNLRSGKAGFLLAGLCLAAYFYFAALLYFMPPAVYIPITG